MRTRKFLSVKTEGAWWKGTISYNLRTLWRFFLLLIVGIYKLVRWLIVNIVLGGWWLLKKFWRLFCVIGMLFAILYLWLKSLKRPKAAGGTRIRNREKSRNYWWLLTLLLLIPLFFLLKDCGGKKSEVIQTPEEVYQESFNAVVFSRAYLDDVDQNNLVGFKFVNGQPVSKFSFSGKPYDESVRVIAEDWKPVVADNISPQVKLSRQQMVATTLLAMRMGKYRFESSEFLKCVNRGDFDGASQCFYLHDMKTGKKIETGEEPMQYLYILRALWEGKIPVDNLLDMPILSYRKLKPRDMFDEQGNLVFNQNTLNKLRAGFRKTPRQALKLE